MFIFLHFFEIGCSRKGTVTGGYCFVVSHSNRPGRTTIPRGTAFLDTYINEFVSTPSSTLFGIRQAQSLHSFRGVKIHGGVQNSLFLYHAARSEILQWKSNRTAIFRDKKTREESVKEVPLTREVNKCRCSISSAFRTQSLIMLMWSKTSILQWNICWRKKHSPACDWTFFRLVCEICFLNWLQKTTYTRSTFLRSNRKAWVMSGIFCMSLVHQSMLTKWLMWERRFNSLPFR